MLVKKGYNRTLPTTQKSFVFKKLHDCKGEGPLQGARRACSACLKGLVLDRVKAPVDRIGKHSLHDREGRQGKRRQSNKGT